MPGNVVVDGVEETLGKLLAILCLSSSPFDLLSSIFPLQMHPSVARSQQPHPQWAGEMTGKMNSWKLKRSARCKPTRVIGWWRATVAGSHGSAAPSSIGAWWGGGGSACVLCQHGATAQHWTSTGPLCCPA